jgi:Ca-activated chloride channel family protein
MHKLAASLIAKINSTKVGLGVLAALAGGTAIAILPHSGPYCALTKPTPVVRMSGGDGVRLTVTPSQRMLVQGATDEIYLDVGIQTPELAANETSARRATDLVLVLDRSGSMADDRKLSYAKTAMQAFVERLDGDDRIALVTFDDGARVDFPLTRADASTKASLQRTIAALGPGGSTNIGEGLSLARSTVDGVGDGGRSSRIILLSDGRATTGITSDEGLSGLVRQVATAGTVVSTIGLGADFNETLLARMSDYGMGSYTYLASVEDLGPVLAKDLSDARTQFAASSRLELRLGEGVSVVDAAGYPVEATAGDRASIPLGQLTAGTMRQITVSLRVPTGSMGEHVLAGVQLAYDRGGASFSVGGDTKPFAVTVVAPEKKAEAAASIDRDVFRKIWTGNNAGRMKKDFSDRLRAGDEKGAAAVVQSFRAQASAAGAGAGIDMRDAALEGELAALEGMAKDVAAAPPAQAEQKAKVYAKEAWSSGLSTQRASAAAPRP